MFNDRQTDLIATTLFLQAAVNRLGDLLDRDDDTANDRRLYDRLCSSLSLAERESEMLSNARLIAVAPELLEALEQAIPWLERLGDVIGNGARDASNSESLGARCDAILKAKKAIAKAKAGD